MSNLMHRRNRAVCCLITIMANLFAAYSAHAQLPVDSSRLNKYFHYSSFTLTMGAAAQFFGHSNGLLSVSFPYVVTDSSGTSANNVFYAQKRKIYNGSKLYWFPVLVEIGRLHHFFDLGVSWSTVEGEFTNGVDFTAGYGFIWYVDGRHRSRGSAHPQRFAIKAALQVTYSTDASGSSSEELGSIDNSNKTIYLLGHTAGPTFTTQASRSTPAKTYEASTLIVAYSQREFSLLPRISIANNPYRSYLRWELMIGYNFPWYDRGGIFLQQQSNDEYQGLGGSVNINNPAITASYNNRPITKAPYRFSGLYASLLLSFGGHKDKGQVSASKAAVSR
jgi:hypothetical protein